MDYSKAISFVELLKAAKQCDNGVAWKNSVAKWMFNVHRNITSLRQDLLSKRYKLSNYVKFTIYEPKRRSICSTKFRDRVVQRSLCNNGLYSALVRPLIYDNGACQINKGTSFTIGRVNALLQKYYRSNNNSNIGYYYLIDIHNYFGSTPHKLLKEVVAKYVTEPNFMYHVFEIIDSFKDDRPQKMINEDPFGERGVGLGSQVSQLLQLLYMNDVDHYAKEQLGLKFYIRYMDDILIFHKDREYLNECFEKIKNMIESKGLELNPKSGSGKIEDGVKFLKVHFKLSSSGSVKHKITKSSIDRELRRISKLVQLFIADALSYKDLMAHFNSWVGHSKPRMSTSQFRIINTHLKKMLEQYNYESNQ